LELNDLESEEEHCDIDDSSGSNNLEKLLRKLPSAKNFTPGNYLSSCHSMDNTGFFNSIPSKNTFKPGSMQSSGLQLPSTTQSQSQIKLLKKITMKEKPTSSVASTVPSLD